MASISQIGVVISALVYSLTNWKLQKVWKGGTWNNFRGNLRLLQYLSVLKN